MSTPRLDPETKSMIAAALDRFVDDVGDVTDRRKRLAQVPVNERLHWEGLAGLGVFGVAVPEALGGLGGGAVDLADALQVLARALLIEPWVESAVMAATLLRAADAVAAFEPVLSGERLLAVVGGHVGRVDTLACEPAGSGWRLNGTVRFATGAACADGWLVVARQADGTPVVFQVAPQAAGISRHDYRLMDGRSASDVRFDATPVEGSALLLQGAEAQTALTRAVTWAAIAFCAEAVGAMAQLVRITRDYLNTRVQFGTPIASYQALQHRLADMQMNWLEARAITRALAGAVDAGEAQALPKLCHAAALVLARTAPLVAHEAIQMHGGMGVTDELVVAHFNARLVVLVKQLQAWVPAVSPLAAEQAGA